MMGTILLVSAARTGSSRFLDICNGYAGIESVGELFHPELRQKSPAPADRLLEESGRFEPGFLATPEGRVWCRTNPVEAINTLVPPELGKTSMAKLFPNHLEPGPLRTLCATQVTGMILLTRRPIDSYISLMKAHALRKWGGVETSELTVPIDLKPYLRYVLKLSLHYAQVKSLARELRIPTLTLRYEDAVNIPDAAVTVAADKVLRGLGAKPGEFHPRSGEKKLFKQDQQTNFARKVSNWEQFTTVLAQRNLLPMLGNLYPERQLGKLLEKGSASAAAASIASSSEQVATEPGP